AVLLQEAAEPGRVAAGAQVRGARAGVEPAVVEAVGIDGDARLVVLLMGQVGVGLAVGEVAVGPLMLPSFARRSSEVSPWTLRAKKYSPASRPPGRVASQFSSPEPWRTYRWGGVVWLQGSW